MFELVDNWCPNIDEEEYAEFFKVLDKKMQYTGQYDREAYDLLER